MAAGWVVGLGRRRRLRRAVVFPGGEPARGPHFLWVGPHTHDFAKRMYGKDTEAARRSVTAYFSRLKARGYVDAVGPGLFKIREKGVRAAIDPDND